MLRGLLFWQSVCIKGLIHNEVLKHVYEKVANAYRTESKSLIERSILSGVSNVSGLPGQGYEMYHVSHTMSQISWVSHWFWHGKVANRNI